MPSMFEHLEFSIRQEWDNILFQKLQHLDSEEGQVLHGPARLFLTRCCHKIQNYFVCYKQNSISSKCKHQYVY